MTGDPGPDRGGGHRLFAALYDRLGARAERAWLGDRRRELLAAAEGVVVEVGAGTGANLPHYRGVARVLALEPDPAMRRRLRRRALAAPVPVEVGDAPAERLPLGDATADTVVCTLVLCSVADPDRALAEARRVLRPGGRLLFIEHVRGEGRRARRQDRLTPVWRRLGAGCHLNRDTVAAIGRAGFRIEALAVHDDDVPGPAISRPMVIGRAV
ncbi:class I SAM-dependent methyltransferase [Miltoncostaea marina]|uniref:class I SAM-dependent methyltransferase n=1 Tax=Miltoncostaea marina TaxID=2843215 RepID=UPI0031BB1C16